MTKPKTYTMNEFSPITAAARQDPQAFAQLYDRFAVPIYRYLYSRTGNQADAEDLTAQTFLTALEKLADYQERGQFKAWLFTIARNKAMDHFRKQPREVQLEAVELAADHRDPLTGVIRSEQVQQVAKLIRSLDESEQELLRLRYVADLSFADMAALLGKSQEAVKKSLYRLQVRMQAQLEVKNG